MLQFIFKVQSAISEYANLSVSCELKPFLLCGLCRDWFTSCKWLGTSRRVGITVGTIRCPDRHSTAWCPSSLKNHSVDPGLGSAICSSILHQRHWRQRCCEIWGAGLRPLCSRILRTSSHCQLQLVCWTRRWLLLWWSPIRRVSASCGQEVHVHCSAVRISAIVRWTSDKWGTVSRSAMRILCGIKPMSISGF